MAYTPPPTFTALNVLTAAQLNTYLRDNFKAIGDAWTAYTPTLGGWTLGNGALTGNAIQVGKFVTGRIAYTVGSTDTKSGAPTFTLPVASTVGVGGIVGQASLLDVSASARAFRYAFLGSATTIILTTENDTRLSPTVPWTWATGDQFWIQFTYEAA